MSNFQNPIALLLLIALPLLAVLYYHIKRKKKKQAIKFSNISFVKSALGNKKKSRRMDILFIISILALGCLIIALSDPHIPLKQAKEGVNVVLVIDVSGSMGAKDYQPNRLEAAKRSAEILINSLKPKDDVGIVTFETGATTASYLSPFKERVIDKLRAIKVKDGSTAIGDGLSLGIDMAISIPNKKKVVILLSDGVANSGVISPDEAILFAKTNDIQVYTIGLGSNEPVVLGYDWFGRPQYAQLDEETLKKIADNTGGKYYKSVDSETLDEIYDNISKDIKREKELTSIKDWFIILAIVLLAVVFYYRYGHRQIIQ